MRIKPLGAAFQVRRGWKSNRVCVSHCQQSLWLKCLEQSHGKLKALIQIWLHAAFVLRPQNIVARKGSFVGVVWCGQHNVDHSLAVTPNSPELWTLDCHTKIATWLPAFRTRMSRFGSSAPLAKEMVVCGDQGWARLTFLYPFQWQARRSLSFTLVHIGQLCHPSLGLLVNASTLYTFL